MASIALDRSDVIVGVDTHKDQHVAVAIDGVGGLIDEPKFLDANNDGYAELLAWARSLGKVHVFAVEGCGSYGIGLARFLRRHGHLPVEVSRPPRAGARRMSGKSDAIDAEHAARTALAGVGVVTPKLADGPVEAIRLVKIARDTAVKAHTTAMITLKAVLVTADQDLRDQLEALSDFKLVTACVGTRRERRSRRPSSRDASHAGVAGSALVRSPRRDQDPLQAPQGAHRGRQHPSYCDAFGVGVDIAAQMLITAGDNADRVRSETAFAKMCGVAPIPTGSGKTSGRHRLNRGGNRQANAALYRAVIVRLRWHAPTIAYLERRTTDGLSKKEIIRCLKRYLARELFQLLPDVSAEHAPAPAARAA